MVAFATAFRPSRFRADAFRPSYGLAEATLVVAAGRWNAHDVCYETFSKYTSVTIVSPQTRRPCSGSQVGELWLTGPGVAAGYWRNVDATRETFNARTVDGAGPFLRTGDLGSFDNGTLRVCGRLKDLLIVCGVKYFPQDLERAAAASHTAVRPGAQAAVAIDADPERGDRVALVVELEPRAARTADPADVITSIRTAVAEACGVRLHGVALVGAGVVPMTPSGKVQRSRARDWWTGPRAGALAVWTLGAIDPGVGGPMGPEPLTLSAGAQ